MKTRIVLIIFSFIITCLLISLGFWQLHRADEKIAWQEHLKKSTIVLTNETLLCMLPEPASPATPKQNAQVTDESPPDSIPPASPAMRGRCPQGGGGASIASSSLMAPAHLKGYWIPEKQFLWDNQMHEGQFGYQVLSLFQLNDMPDMYLLVNRGWIKGDLNRKILPTLPPLPPASQTIEGRFFNPQTNPMIKKALETDNISWPLRFQKMDWALFESLVGHPLYPQILYLNEGAENTFVTKHPKPPITAEKHKAYAIQWFGLAGVFILLLFLKIRAMRAKTNRHTNSAIE